MRILIASFLFYLMCMPLSAQFFSLQGLDNTGSIVSNGEGVFVDSRGSGVAPAVYFKGAAKVVVTSSTGSKHNVTRIIGYNPELGVVKFSVDNTLSLTLAKPDFVSGIPATVQQVQLSEDGREQTSSLPVSKTLEMEGIGTFVIFDKAVNGAARSGQSIAGVIVKGQKGSILVNQSIIQQIPSVNYLMDGFAAVVSDDLLVDAIVSVADENWQAAINSVSGNSILANYLKGYASFQDHRYQDAEQAFQQVIAVKNNHAPSLYYLGKMAFENDMQSLVIDYLTNALSAGSKESDIYAMRGKAYYDLSNYQLASADFEKAMQYDPTADIYFSYGNTEFQQENYSSAIEKYTNAINKQLESHLVYNNRGKAYFFKEEYQKAIQDFVKASTLDPTYTKSYFNLVLTYFELSNWKEVVANANKVIEQGGQTGEIFYKKGVAHYQLKQFKETIAAIEKANSAGYPSEDGNIIMGNAHFQLENYQQVVDNLLNRATKPSDVRALGVSYFKLDNFPQAAPLLTSVKGDFNSDLIFMEALALSKIAVGDTALALVSLVQAKTLGSENPEVYVKLGEIQFEAGQAAAEENLLKAQQLGAATSSIDIMLGEIAFSHEDYTLVINQFTKAGNTALSGSNLVKLGISQYKTGNLNGASTSFAEATTKGVNTPELHGWYGRTLFEQKQYAKAVSEFSKTMGQQQDNATLYAYAGSLFETQDFSNCITIADKAVANGGTKPQLQLWLGMSAYQTNNFEKASPALQKAVQQGVANSETYLALGLIQSSKNEYAKAIINLNEAEKRGETESKLYLERAKARQKTNDVTGALNDLTTALSKDQTLTSAYQIRASLYYNMKQYANAITDVKAFESNGGTATIGDVSTLGMSQYYQSDLEAAKQNLERATRMGEVSAEVNLILGEISFKLEDYADVLKYYEPMASGLSTQQTFQAGYAAYRIKDYGRAIQLLNKAYSDGFKELLLLEALGQSYYAEKDYNRAADVLNAAEAAGSADPEIYKNLGNAWFRTEKYGEAISSYDRALAMDPNDAVILNNRGKARLLIKQYNEAVNDFSAALAIDPNYIKAQSNRAQAFYFLKNYVNALTDFEKLITTNAADGEAYNFAGLSAFYTNDYAKAIGFLTTAEQQGALQPEGYKARAIAYLQNNDLEKSSADFERAVGALSDDDKASWGDALFLQEQYELAAGKYSSVAKTVLSPEQMYRLGRSFYEMKQYENAQNILNAAISADPSLGLAFAYRGNTRFRQNDYEGAISDYDKAIDNNVTEAIFYNNRGKAYYNLEKKERAIEDYTQAINVNPEYAKAYENRGVARFELEQFQDAIADFRSMEELADGDARSFFMLGRAYFTMEDYPLSIVYLERAQEGGFENYELFKIRADAKMQIESFPEAVEDYGKAIEYNQSSAESFQGRARAYFYMQEDRRAIDDAGKAIKFAPENHEMYLDRAAILMELENFTAAVEDYKKAIELNPNEEDPYYYTAEAYYNLEMYRQALDALQGAMMLNPNRGEFYNLSGIIKYMIEDEDGACEDWQKAADLGYENARSSLSRYCN